MADQPLHPVSRRHLDEMTGELGTWEHATGTTPERSHGYCTDDVARALAVDLLHARELGWQAVRHGAWRSLRFLRDAWSPARGRFRNRRDVAGAWQDDEGTEDTQGRAFLALGLALREPADQAFTADARMLFATALPAIGRLHAVRPIASCIVGCDAALRGDALAAELRDEAMAALRHLTGRLRRAFPAGDGSAAWPWPEAQLTYENALLPHALVVGGDRGGDAAASALGFRVLEWLAAVERSPDGWFSPIGNQGWWRRDGTRARFDQQPIEATTHILACEAALEVSSDPRWRAEAERAYGWFLGDNDSRLQVAEPSTGGCHDGLGPTRVNVNQGTESTLMWLTALEHMRALRRPVARRDADRMPAGSPARTPAAGATRMTTR